MSNSFPVHLYFISTPHTAVIMRSEGGAVQREVGRRQLPLRAGLVPVEPGHAGTGIAWWGRAKVGGDDEEAATAGSPWPALAISASAASGTPAGVSLLH
jgi:hypothetical protein